MRKASLNARDMYIHGNHARPLSPSSMDVCPWIPCFQLHTALVPVSVQPVSHSKQLERGSTCSTSGTPSHCRCVATHRYQDQLSPRRRKVVDATGVARSLLATKNPDPQTVRMRFGQVVVGPPGSGKTTYCRGLQEFLHGVGRESCVLNLDPANDRLPYECDVDLRNLVEAEEVQTELGLGPNGSMVYCMDYLASNLDWLEERIHALPENAYMIIDCPGQVELFTLHDSLRKVIEHMVRTLQCRLACVHLIDAHLCQDAGKYIGAVLLSLNTMLHLALPHVNVLSKVDLLGQYGEMTFDLEYYTDAQDLEYLLCELNTDPLASRFEKLNRGLCEVVEDYGLVQFMTLHVEDKELMGQLLKGVDKAVGYVATGQGANPGS